ncbi:phosphotransferase [Sporosarcina luteola]|uniref:phosphotransferase enzyme family protein n=1 Tax=Sporosarcina luteola TaxID=582850 RepID=UPI00204249AF|nr:phosphotransferase [Sporosarcina luteola]MCM3745218.1 phosphotransferase [Sporosarcina luteola]
MNQESEKLIQRLTNLLSNDLMEIVPAADGYHNQVFIVTRSTDRIVARISPRSGKTIKDIETELDWIAALDKAGVSVAKAITLPGHKQIIALDTDKNGYWLTFFRHTEGRPVEVADLTDWNKEFFHEWGSQLARMHNVDASRIDRPVYLDSFNKNKRSMPEWLNSRHSQLLNEMRNWERHPDTFGIVHNDLHQGNFHLNDSGLIFFDFADCAYHFHMQDLAVSIYHALWTGTAFHPEVEGFPIDFLLSFLSGYKTYRRLTSEMYDQLLVCLQMREVYLYALFVSEWNKDDIEDWQVEKLRELEVNSKAKVIPYQKHLEKVKHLFL